MFLSVYPLVPSQVVSAPSHTLSFPCIVASREYCHPLRNKLAALDVASSSAGKETLPVSLQGITTPLKLEYWQQQLSSHPDGKFAQLILNGMEQGFKIGFQHSSSQLRSKGGNMLSTRSHPEVVSEYIATELALGRIAEVGLAETAKKSGIHTSPFGVIPKKHKSNKWRLILDLSSPQGFSVNDGISKESSSISYTTTDYVVEAILKSGKGTLMAKLDIKQAYRNIPVYPTDRPLLGMSWDGKVYVDKTLPFGLRSAPVIFSAVADALGWIMSKNGVTILFNYLDDFLTLGKPGSNECQLNLTSMLATCNSTGLPVEVDKCQGPVSCILFLGMELDSVALEIRLPGDKLANLKSLLHSWRGRKACRKRELLSLIGSLSHACKAVRSGRAFLRRLIDLSTTASHLDHFIRLNQEARSDIEWWHTFASSWNGVAMMKVVSRVAPKAWITSDASGSWGCGAFSGQSWFQLKWVEQVQGHSITVKELIPIVVATAVWGPTWRGSSVQVLCDNAAVVAILNQNSSRDKEVMHLIRCLAFITAKFQFLLSASHIPGVENTAADALSRNNLDVFHSIYPQANSAPAPIPAPLLDLLLLSKPDWTSWSWTELWNDIFSKD